MTCDLCGAISLIPMFKVPDCERCEERLLCDECIIEIKEVLEND